MSIAYAYSEHRVHLAPRPLEQGTRSTTLVLPLPSSVLLLGPPPWSSCSSSSISNSNLKHQLPPQKYFPLMWSLFLILVLAAVGQVVRGSLAQNEKIKSLISQHIRKPSLLQGLSFWKSLVQDHLKIVKLNSNQYCCN